MDDSILETLKTVSSVEEFKVWTRDRLRAVLPHGALVAGLGHLHAGGVGLDYLVTVDFPATHLESIRNRAGAIETPILRRWLLTQAPVYFDVANPWPDTPEPWLESFNSHQLRNVLAHAMYDTERCVGTYYSLFAIPGTPNDEYYENLVVLVPAMHEVLCWVIEQAQTLAPLGMMIDAMTEREKRLIRWLRYGKTNAEIAALAGLSENTVKHYVSGVFTKLGVRNRAQLVRRLVELETQATPGATTRVL